MAGQRREKTHRRKLFDLHSWLGFNLAVFMSLVVVTGTFAVIADEIDWMIHGELRATPADKLEKISWGQLQKAIHAYAPKDTLATLSTGEGDYLAYKALMYDTYGNNYYLYINPWTGEVTGTTSTLTVQRFLRDLHRYLFMPAIIGLPLVTCMAVVLLISLYTGLKTVRNWTTVATRLRFNKGVRIALGDFHKAAGLWGSWFLILIVITSFWYFAELMFAIGDVGFEPNRPGVTLDRVAATGASAQMADADTLVNAAIEAYPGFQPNEIQFATTAILAATVLGRKGDPLVRNRANRVFLDPFDASVIKVQRSPEISWFAYVNELADPLHFGSFGKLTTKVIWFVFGLALFSLTVTGVLLTWKRVKTKTPSTSQLATLPLIAIVTIVGFNYVQAFINSKEPERFYSLAQQNYNGVKVELVISIGNDNQPDGTILLKASTDDNSRLNLASGRIQITNTEHRAEIRPGLLGAHVTLFATLPPESITNSAVISATLTFYPDKTITRQWSLAELTSNTIATRLAH